ncbi:hypothetical protein ACS0TY_033870 [Phlomoides rotata]
MEEASEALNAIQAESTLYGDSGDRLLAEIDCTVHLNIVMNQHQINSTQRNRLQWLQDGDRNSWFFHTMNRICKTSIDLSSLIVDSELTFDLGIISDSVVLFYMELFTDQDTYDDSILGDFIHPVVVTAENDALVTLPGVEEIRRAVLDMEPSSSHGPDGFNDSFYQTCWDIIAFDVIEAVGYFFTTVFIHFGLNSSFITLIPKKPGANRVEDFRPIVMGNYLFKIFTKILASRLGVIAARILTPFQFGATAGNIRCFQGVFSAYGGLSGQVYNLAKSMVYFGTAVTRWVRRFILRTTGISHGSLPFSYLGVPIFRGAPCTCHLAALADSIINKWKGHSLSSVGRKCMINFVIAASLVQSMMDDISGRNNSCSVSWARVCSSLDDGGLGVRSIRLANDSFICKLAWDIICNRSSNMALLHDRYISIGGKPRTSRGPSSIGPGIRRHLGRLVTGSRWVVGHSSGISFWNDNWLGSIISDRIGIPPSFDIGLSSTIRDYFYDEIWHFDYKFFMKHTDIVRDILSIHVSRGSDSQVRGSSVSG